MPADLDQFRGEDSHGAVIGGKGLVQLRHVAPDARGLLNQVNLEAGRGKIKRGLDAADPSPNDHDVPIGTVLSTLGNLFHLFFFHFYPPLSNVMVL
jgi:hypothetical protein